MRTSLTRHTRYGGVIMGIPENPAEFLILIQERLAKFEKDENMQLSDDFK